MKPLTICLVAVFYTMTSWAQITPEPQLTPDLTINQTEPLASVVKTDFIKNQKLYRDYSYSDCAKYHKMKVAGIVLAAVGGGMFITGAVVNSVAPASTIYEEHGRYYRSYSGAQALGTGMMVIGSLSVVAGIPLAIIGSVKGKKYCRQRSYEDEHTRSSLELQSGQNGMGLALKF